MAKCKGCGVELLDGTVFCPYCGAQVESEQREVEKPVEVINNDGTTYVNENPATSTYEFKEKGVFKVFAILGMVFGIVVLSFVGLTLLSMGNPFVALYLSAFALEFSVPGLVFSCIGKKSVKNHGKAVFGFVANLVCLILSFILLFVCAFMFVAEGGSPDDFTGGFYF